jgi:hypothetical protein
MAMAKWTPALFLGSLHRLLKAKPITQREIALTALKTYSIGQRMSLFDYLR